MTTSTAVESSGDQYSTMEHAIAEPTESSISGRKQKLLCKYFPPIINLCASDIL